MLSFEPPPPRIARYLRVCLSPPPSFASLGGCGNFPSLYAPRWISITAPSAVAPLSWSFKVFPSSYLRYEHRASQRHVCTVHPWERDPHCFFYWNRVKLL